MIFKLLQRSFVIAIYIIITATYSYSDNKPQRIVSLSPNLTQVIYALGYMDQVVGVTIFDEYPPQVIDLPKVGGWINPNYSNII